MHLVQLLSKVVHKLLLADPVKPAGSQSEGGAAARAFIQASCPMFEAFWQGRLIPGARIDSLPFVEARLICCVRYPPMHAAPNTACLHNVVSMQEVAAWPPHAELPGTEACSHTPHSYCTASCISSKHRRSFDEQNPSSITHNAVYQLPVSQHLNAAPVTCRQ